MEFGIFEYITSFQPCVDVYQGPRKWLRLHQYQARSTQTKNLAILKGKISYRNLHIPTSCEIPNKGRSRSILKIYCLYDRWICFYPAYIDSNRTRVAGRRIPKSRAVARPTCTEICDVLTAANFKVGLEPKFYPRDSSKEEDKRGRVRVQLKNEDGTPVNPDFPTRKILKL